MDLSSSTVASASLIALLVIVGWTLRNATPTERRDAQRVLLGVAGLVLGAAVLAFLWTLSRS